MVTGYPAVETVVSSLRHALIAAPGKVYVSGDYAGIQARVVLALSGQRDRVDRWTHDPSYDPYCDMASLIYCRAITKADKEERQTGKNSVLGLGFQMGWRKFKIKYARKQPDEFCQRVVKTYREEFAPCVPKLWKALEHAAVATVHDRTPHQAYGVEYALSGNWLTARLPSGRLLWYRNPRPTYRTPPWEDAVPQPSFTYQVMKNGRWITVDAYGGLLTENVVMGIEVDIQRHGMYLLEENGFPIVLEVYDEIVCEPDKENADERAFAQIMVDQPAWVRSIGVPIAVETWQGPCYRK
jgi:DNA polymerase